MAEQSTKVFRIADILTTGEYVATDFTKIYPGIGCLPRCVDELVTARFVDGVWREYEK